MIEIGDLRGISFTDEEIARIETEEDAVKGIRRMFARMLNKRMSEVKLTPRVEQMIIEAWRSKRKLIQ